MLRRKRLALHAALILALSTLAFATIRQTRPAPHVTPSGTDAPRADRSLAGKLPNKVSERPRQIATDARKQHITTSPDNRVTIYHLPFNPYQTHPEPVVFITAENSTGSVLQEIPVLWSARYVSTVDWIDNRYVEVRGEAGYLAILDTGAGVQTHNLVGSDFTISPDGKQIIYRHNFNPRYGEVPPEYESDYVLFSLVAPRGGSGRVESRYGSDNYQIIYPMSCRPQKLERKAFRNLGDRHQIRSPFIWSTESQRVAFVEWHQNKLQLLILQPEINHDQVIVSPQRLQLNDDDESITSVSWLSEAQLKVTGGEKSWLIDLLTHTVQQIP